MKIARVLIYDGDEAAIMGGLADRAVRGFRMLGNGVACSEYVFEGGAVLQLEDFIDRVPSAGTSELADRLAPYRKSNDDGQA
jgi:hypothetical protein